ncbi:MAG: GIDE domain-containing protein [Halobacteria archaeon]|nr:GIDE domain-containing protein [Halobacteria archaeon]
MVFQTLLIIGGTALGFLAIWGGFYHYKKHRLIRDTPTSKIRSLALGMVEIKGKPREYEKTLKSPFTNEDCFRYVYSIQRETQDSEGHKSWSTVEAGTKSVEFYLDDGTGQVLVDPEGAEFSFKDKERNQYVFDSYEEVPDEMKEFLERRDEEFDNHKETGLSSTVEFAQGPKSLRMGDDDLSGKRKYVEEYLPADADEVYVFGRAVRRPDASSAENVENLMVTRGEGDPLFKISDKSEKEVASKAGRMGLSGLVFGFIFTVAGFAGSIYLYSYFGIFIFGIGIGAGFLFEKAYGRD